MTITVLVPDWNATDKLKESIELNGYAVEFNPFQSCDVIQLNGRVETMPDNLKQIPMRAVILVKHNSNPTMATDGLYVDDHIVARVETYFKDGVLQQSIQVTGGGNNSIEELNQWFDYLAQGKKNDKNTSPIKAVPQWARLKASGGSGPSFHMIEIELKGDPRQVVVDITEVLNRHFDNLKSNPQ